MSTAFYQENEDDIGDLEIWLGRLSTLYFAFPVILFIGWWLNAGAAALFLLLLLFGIVRLWGTGTQNLALSFAHFIKTLWARHAIVACVFFVWCALSGTAGFGSQTPEQLQNAAVLKALIESPWPLAGHTSLPLVYHVFYFLPAAWVGKGLGWEAANAAFFVWTFVGVMLVWSVLSLSLALDLLNRWRKLTAALIFIFFGGWDYIGAFFNWTVHSQLTNDIETWAGVSQYLGHTTQLFSAPHHSLGAWLATAFLLLVVRRGVGQAYVLLISAFSFLWCPIASVGLLPFLIILVAFEASTRGLKELINPVNLFIAPACATLGVLFYSSQASPLGGVWQFSDSGFMEKYLLLIVLECLVLGVPFFLQHLRQRVFLNQISLPPPLQLSPAEKAFGWSALLFLALIPFYRLGPGNELSIQASIPALFVLASFFMKILRREFTFQYIPFATTATCALIGSIAATHHIHHSVVNYRAISPVQKEVASFEATLEQPQFQERPGRLQAFFWKWLGPIGPNEQKQQ